MLATLAGCLALALGVAMLLLPVLVSELSRPRDAVWGAVVLLLGLVLVTGAERLTGAPMLAVLCGGLLVGRLGVEVGQGRWRMLTEEEQQRLASPERWRNGLGQLGAALAAMVAVGLGWLAGGLGGQPRRRSGKRWVRPESPASAGNPDEPATTGEPGETDAPGAPDDRAMEGVEAAPEDPSDTVVVSGFRSEEHTV